MTERLPKSRLERLVAMTLIGSVVLSACTAAEADKTPESELQSDTMQSAPEHCKSPVASETNEKFYVDLTFADSVREAQEAAENEAELSDMLREVFRKETRTNPMFLAAEAFQMGLATKEQFSNAKSALVKEGCLSEQGEITYELYSTALDDYNFEIVELSGDYYTTGVDMNGNLFIDPRVGVMSGGLAIRKVPKSKEIALAKGLKEHYTSCICANTEIFAGTDISNLPQNFVPWRPDVPQRPNPPEGTTPPPTINIPPAPGQPQQPGPQPKGNAGVELPEGTQGKVDWNPSGYGHIGPETAVPAGPQVQNEGSSEWTYTPHANPQVAPGAPSNTAVAPGATKPTETPKSDPSDPAITVSEGSGTGKDLSKTDNNDTDDPPQD